MPWHGVGTITATSEPSPLFGGLFDLFAPSDSEAPEDVLIGSASMAEEETVAANGNEQVRSIVNTVAVIMPTVTVT